MADHSYTLMKSYADTNINTNNARAITGAKHNTMLTYILQALGGKLFDATRPYKEGQVLAYEDPTFGMELWYAPSDVAAAAWNAASFTRLSKRGEKITASDTPYKGIELGAKQYSHHMGHIDFIVQAFDSAGANIPLNITAKRTTKITIESSVAYANAVILIQEILIP